MKKLKILGLILNPELGILFKLVSIDEIGLLN